MNFHKTKDGGESILYSPIGHLIDSSLTLKPGIYRVDDCAPPMKAFIPRFSPIKEGEGLIKFEGGLMKDILGKFSVFFSDEVKKKYATLKMTHKLGIVLYGPPGTGKTALVKLLMLQELESHGAICLDCTDLKPVLMAFTVGLIRAVQDTPIIIFYDEFEDYAESGNILTFLDGMYSYNNLIFIGCTNYIKRIPKRLKDRKSRIKYVFEIKTLESAVYKEYIKGKIPDISKEVLDKYTFLAAEADLTIDQLKNSLIDYYVDGVEIEKAIKEAKKIIEEDPRESLETSL